MSTQIADNLNIPNDQWITASVSGTGNFTGDRSQTLIANSSWSQVNGGVPFGTSFGSMVAVRNYRGGTSEIWNGYGGFASTYCGTESQSWNDPSIASYDARNLNGTRFTPHNPPGVPAPYPFSTTSKTFVMPPALVEDTEAAAGQKQTWLEWAVDQGVGFIPVYGSARDAYRAYKEGDNLGLGLNVSMLGLELFTFGGASVAKGVVKSSLKAEKSLMKLGGKALKSKGDDALKLVDNKIDNVGRSLIDDTAGGAKGISSEVTGVSQKYLGCFAVGTPIQTPSGSKPIEEFVPSDWVLAQDESDPDAVPTLRQVEEVFENQAQVMVMGLGGREIETTPEHPFWVRDKGWTAAKAIEPGDELRSHDGQWIPLDSKHLTDNIVTVYNMRVAEDHTYFVGSPLWGFTVWAHNRCYLNDPITEQLTTTQRKTLRKQATRIWEKNTGLKASLNDMEIHHRIPLEWAHIFPKADPNRLANLIAIRSGPHDLIDNAWRVWKQQLNGRIPRQVEVLAQAMRVDSQFGQFFVYIG